MATILSNDDLDAIRAAVRGENVDLADVISEAINQGNLDLADFISSIKDGMDRDHVDMVDAITAATDELGLNVTDAIDAMVSNAGLDLSDFVDATLSEGLVNQSDVICGAIDSLGDELKTAYSKAVRKAARKAVKKVNRHTTEEAENTRRLINRRFDELSGDGILTRPWNWLVGILAGDLAAAFVLFLFKLAQYKATAACRDLTLLNYICNADMVKMPMCDVGTPFWGEHPFTAGFWLCQKGSYWMGMAVNTHDSQAIWFYLVIAVMITVGVGVGAITAEKFRKSRRNPRR